MITRSKSCLSRDFQFSHVHTQHIHIYTHIHTTHTHIHTHTMRTHIHTSTHTRHARYMPTHINHINVAHTMSHSMCPPLVGEGLTKTDIVTSEYHVSKISTRVLGMH